MRRSVAIALATAFISGTVTAYLSSIKADPAWIVYWGCICGISVLTGFILAIEPHGRGYED